jgi:hypothetical protein
MSIRTLHCSTDVENYNACIKNNVVAFKNNAPQTGDTVYLIAKIGNAHMCTARGVLGVQFNVKTIQPLFNPNSANELVSAFKLKKIQYTTPFDISQILSSGFKHWGTYFQGHKPLPEDMAKMIDVKFNSTEQENIVLLSTDCVSVKSLSDNVGTLSGFIK